MSLAGEHLHGHPLACMAGPRECSLTMLALSQLPLRFVAITTLAPGRPAQREPESMKTF